MKAGCGGISGWLVLACLLGLAAAIRWLGTPIAAGTACILFGGVLLISAQLYAPNRLLLGWSALIALAAARLVAQTVIPWLQRLRSS